jgi:hypothetical protein
MSTLRIQPISTLLVRQWLITLLLILTLLPVWPRIAPATAPMMSTVVRPNSLPLIFAPTGDPVVPFSAFGQDGTLGFQPAAVIVAMSPSQRLRVRFVAANSNTRLTPMDRKAGVIHRYFGVDAAQWQTSLPTFGGLTYQGLYPGIDLRYDGRDGSLKGTYTVAPGVNPDRIRWQYEGAQNVTLDSASGDLHITLADERILIERAPIAWQEWNGQRVPVQVHFTLSGVEAGFTVGAYDANRPLVIDPTLVYGTFAGGSSGDYARGIAVDAQGHAYVVGDTLSTDFLGFNVQVNGSYDVIVLKFNATASDLDYGVLIGGSSSDQGLGVAVNAQGEAYVTVDAESTDFPIVNARYPDRPADNHGVLLKFAANGDLAYSTWLPFGVGNSFSGHNVAVDSQNNVIVTGELYTALHTARDLAVLKLNPAGTQTLFYKSWSGDGDVSSETGSAVAIGPNDAIYLTGYVPGPFPGFAVTPNALQSQCGRKLALGDNRDCDDDAFLVILDSAGTVTYASYLGGNGGDRGTGIAVGPDGSIVVTGDTFAPDFPTTTGALMTTCHADPSLGSCYYDTFVTKFAPGGTSIEWSTYLNSDESNVLDFSKGIATDAQGNIYVAGYTAGTHFPVQNALQNSLSLGNCSGGFTRFCFDAYLTAFAPDGSLINSTYLGGTGDEYTGGLAIDPQRNVYLTGYSYSAHFPTTTGVIQPQAGPGAEFFIAKIGAGGGGGGGNLPHKVYLPMTVR